MGAPGSGAQNAGYAVTYGDLGETNRNNLVRMLDQQNQARQDQADAQQQADAAHKFALQKYYGKEFDPSNYNTQNDLNQRITQMSGDSLKRVSDLINSGASDQDIEAAANQEVGGLRQTYQLGTALQNNINTSLEGYKADKTLAPYYGALAKNTELNVLYKKDPATGKLVLKSNDELSQLDPSHNYAADVLQNNPQLVMPGNVDWQGYKKAFTPVSQELSGEHYTSPGVKSKNDFKATWLDGLQNLVRDDKGAYHVSTLSDPITTTDANGKQVQIDALPQSSIDTMQSTPGMKAQLDVATMHYLAQHSPNVSVAPGTPAFENAKRIMAYQMTKDWGAKSISDKQSVNKSEALTKIELGYPMPGSGGAAAGNKNDETQASFSDISNTPFVGDNGVKGTITNGQFQPAKRGAFAPLYGTPKYNGGEMTGTIPISNLPLSVRDAVAKWSPHNDIKNEIDPTTFDPTNQVKVKIENGQVTGVMTKSGQWFDVNSRTNSDIKLQNSKTSIKNKQNYKLPDAKGGKNAKDYNL
jgi:hypothetical protein